MEKLSQVSRRRAVFGGMGVMGIGAAVSIEYLLSCAQNQIDQSDGIKQVEKAILTPGAAVQFLPGVLDIQPEVHRRSQIYDPSNPDSLIYAYGLEDNQMEVVTNPIYMEARKGPYSGYLVYPTPIGITRLGGKLTLVAVTEDTAQYMHLDRRPLNYDYVDINLRQAKVEGVTGQGRWFSSRIGQIQLHDARDHQHIQVTSKLAPNIFQGTNQ